MPAFADALGNTYTASSEDSVSRFNNVVGAYLASEKVVMTLLEGVIENDGEMIMALCLRAYMLKLAADPRFEKPFHALLARITALGDAANDRERKHIAALESWGRNDMIEAGTILESILNDYPRDMVALRVAHYLHFYAGTPEQMRDSVARSVKAWDNSMPFYGYLLGMYAFGLEESGQYPEAEAAGKQAIDIDTSDVWAAHAVQHVFQMTSRFDDGIEWMTRLMPSFDGVNNFVYHMHWHKALCHIGQEDFESVLDIYDNHLVPALEDDFYLDVCNAASLLWRLEMLGVDVGDRWLRVDTFSKPRIKDRELLFSALHYLMTPARLGEKDVVEDALASFDAWSKEDSTQGEICRTVGLPLARAIVDLADGNSSAASATLEKIAPDVQLIGGSHAQRDLFTQFQSFAQQATA